MMRSSVRDRMPGPQCVQQVVGAWCLDDVGVGRQQGREDGDQCAGGVGVGQQRPGHLGWRPAVAQQVEQAPVAAQDLDVSPVQRRGGHESEQVVDQGATSQGRVHRVDHARHVEVVERDRDGDVEVLVDRVAAVGGGRVDDVETECLDRRDEVGQVTTVGGVEPDRPPVVNSFQGHLHVVAVVVAATAPGRHPRSRRQPCVVTWAAKRSRSRRASRRRQHHCRGTCRPDTGLVSPCACMQSHAIRPPLAVGRWPTTGAGPTTAPLPMWVEVVRGCPRSPNGNGTPGGCPMRHDVGRRWPPRTFCAARRAAPGGRIRARRACGPCATSCWRRCWRG